MMGLQPIEINITTIDIAIAPICIEYGRAGSYMRSLPPGTSKVLLTRFSSILSSSVRRTYNRATPCTRCRRRA